MFFGRPAKARAEKLEPAELAIIQSIDEAVIDEACKGDNTLPTHIQEVINLIPSEQIVVDEEESDLEEEEEQEREEEQEEEYQREAQESLLAIENVSNSIYPDPSAPSQHPLYPHPDTLAAEAAQQNTAIQTHQEGVRTRMRLHYSKQHTIKVFEVDELVMLKIPREDRANTDNLRLLCRVIEVPKENR